MPSPRSCFSKLHFSLKGDFNFVRKQVQIIWGEAINQYKESIFTTAFRLGKMCFLRASNRTCKARVCWVQQHEAKEKVGRKGHCRAGPSPSKVGFRNVTACALLRGCAAEIVKSEVVNSPHDNNSL